MQDVFTDQVRLALLVSLCGLLWSLESLVPLYQYRNRLVKRFGACSGSLRQ
jgi:hypothetical protein